MRTVTFYADTNRSGGKLHVETDGCIVNITVGLRNLEGCQVTRIDVLPDDEVRGGKWKMVQGSYATLVELRGEPE